MAPVPPDAPADGPLLVSQAFALRHRDGHTLETAAEFWPLPSSMGDGSLLMVLPTPQS
jgi:two-component system CheB/CheR fusion protein